jgi:hypothetical protein
MSQRARCFQRATWPRRSPRPQKPPHNRQGRVEAAELLDDFLIALLDLPGSARLDFSFLVAFSTLWSELIGGGTPTVA